MSSQDDILDVSRLNLSGDFVNQVQQLLCVVRLTRQEVEGLTRLMDDLEDILQSVWCGCKVYPFGSIVTGLGIRTSDVDCFVDLPAWEKLPGNKIVYKAKNILMKRNTVFSELFAIPMAKVPIVKFYHIPTQRHCDVSFKSPSGVENSKLLAYLLHIDERALPLAIILKYWSKVHGLTGTNLLPNYALTLLVIFYLQVKNIVPPVVLLQQSAEHNTMIDDWNVAFYEMNYTSNNTESFYELLGEFFEYYSKFDFERDIISVFSGCTIPKESFKKLPDVPEEYSLYKENVRKRLCFSLKVDTKICVQDPFQHCRNCTVAVYPKLADKLRAFFRNGCKMYKELESHQFLKGILNKVHYKEVVSPHSAAPGRVQKNKNLVNHRPMLPGRIQMNQFKKLKQNMKNNVLNLYAEYSKWQTRR